jgi:hypothetical protein
MNCRLNILSGWFNLKSIKTRLVYNAKTPRNTIRMTAGTIPTAAKDDGSERVPYVTCTPSQYRRTYIDIGISQSP